MEITNQDYWDLGVKNQTSDCGNRIYSYASEWADLMEARMKGGEKLEDIANETAHEADTGGITGFMYGAAVSVLSRVWKHGDDLRRWHNLDTQIQDEGERANESGGVLDPTTMSIGV